MTFTLPIVTSCDACSCCCMEQESPPGYVAIVSCIDDGRLADLVGWPHLDDVVRVRALPPELLAELRVYRVLAGEKRNSSVCIWMDPLRKRCRHHEHRPQICRDFEVGSPECINWRKEFKWGQ